MPTSNHVPNSKDTPLLSIIIPVLEPDEELSRCVQSILGSLKSHQAPEIIIVTQSKFLDKIKKLYPNTIPVSETRKGIYSAMNDGAKLSRGKYLFFMGKDDILLTTLSQALTILDKNQPFVLSCDVYWGYRGVYSGNTSKLRLLWKNLCHQGIIYSRAAFDRFGPYSRKMHVQADHYLNIKILWSHKNNEKILYLKKPLSWYSGDGFSMTNRDLLFWKLYPLILRKYVGWWAELLLTALRLLRKR